MNTKKAVAEALRDVHESLNGLSAFAAEETRRRIDRLILAVLKDAAEVVRADTGHVRYGSATDYANRHAALIDPDSPMNRITKETR